MEFAEYEPKSLYEATKFIFTSLSDEEIEFIRKEKYNAVPLVHMTFGRSVRNQWGLWENSELKRYFNSLGIGHPDDMSSIILRTVVAMVCGFKYDLKEDIESHKKYWIDKGIDPLKPDESF